MTNVYKWMASPWKKTVSISLPKGTLEYSYNNAETNSL